MNFNDENREVKSLTANNVYLHVLSALRPKSSLIAFSFLNIWQSKHYYFVLQVPVGDDISAAAS